MKSPLNDQSSELNPDPSDTQEPPLPPSACVSDGIIQVSFSLSFFASLCRHTRVSPYPTWLFHCLCLPCVLKSFLRLSLTEPCSCRSGPITCLHFLLLLGGIWLGPCSGVIGFWTVFLYTSLRDGNWSHSWVIFCS